MSTLEDLERRLCALEHKQGIDALFEIHDTPPADDATVTFMTEYFAKLDYLGMKAAVEGLVELIRRGEVPEIMHASAYDAMVDRMSDEVTALRARVAELEATNDRVSELLRKVLDDLAVRCGERDQLAAELAALKARKVTLPELFKLNVSGLPPGATLHVSDLMRASEVREVLRAAGIEVEVSIT